MSRQVAQIQEEGKRITMPKSSGRYATSPTEIPWDGWKDILARVARRFTEADISLRAAGVAFFTFFSIFPAIAAAVLLYGLFLDRETLRQHLATIQPQVPDQAFSIIDSRLEALLAQPQTGIGIGLAASLAIAFWSGSRGVGSLVTLMTKAQREEEERNFFVAAALSIGLTLAGIFGFAIAVFLVAAIPAAVAALPLPTYFETLALWLRWPILAVFIIGALIVLYKIAPDRKSAQLGWVWPGALLAGSLWLLLSIMFSIYVQNFGNYSATFGTLSAAVVLMLWLYYSIMVFAIGAVFNAEIEYQTRTDTTSGAPRPMGKRGAIVADTMPETAKRD